MKIPLFITASALCQLTAGELTIQSKPLETTLELEATFLPAESAPIRLAPEQWSTFVITELADHGAEVSKGDTVLSFESESYLRQLEEQTEAEKSRKIALAREERELADLEVTTPQALEGLKLAHRRAEEALNYFNETGRALRMEDARQSLERAKRSLRYQEEELEQLLKMYQEDGLTEETEEIILTRQRAAVDSAKFSLKKTELATTWELEKTIPRQGIDLRRAFDQAVVAYETGKVNLPRTLAEKTLALAKAKRAHAKADQDLAKLEADGKFLTLEAPVTGTVYHGEIKKGSWSLGNTPKFLFQSGTAPVESTLMTLVPAGTALTLHGDLDQADFLALPAEATGSATVAGLNGTPFPVAVTAKDSAPNGGGRYHLEMSVDLPDTSPIVTGMKAKVSLVTYRNEDAICIPDEALTTVDGKATVKLKMADGKDETREVKTGRQVDGQTEILEGLEVDQVIILPSQTNS